MITFNIITIEWIELPAVGVQYLVISVCVTTSDKPGQTDRLMSVYVAKKKNKPPKTLNIAQNQNLMI